MARIALVVLVAFFGVDGLQAQSAITEHTIRLEEGAERPKASVADLAWMEGSWRGEGLDGVVEEMWSAPSQDAILGTFRLLQDGKTVFSELITIVDDAGSVVFRVKHFTPEFVGWEEKEGSVDFPLVKLGHQEAYFRGLTIKLESPDRLKIYLAMRSSAGELNEVTFDYHRVTKNGP